MSVAVDLELTPSLDEVRELAREHTLVPLRHTFIADCETPVSAYLKLRGDGPSFLLESAEQGQRVGRWSFLGFRPRTRDPRCGRGEHPRPLRARGRGARARPNRSARRAAAVRRRRGGHVRLRPRAHARADRGRAEPPTRPACPSWPLMVTDVLRRLRPPAARGHGARERRDGAATSSAPTRRRPPAIAEVRERLRGPVPRGRAGARASRRSSSRTSAPSGYAAAVEQAKEYIRAGDVYQVVPSQRWTANCPVDAFSIYRGLRAINPSPYMYFLDFEDFEIAGASPESLVKVDGQARGAAPDRRHAAARRARRRRTCARARELLADEKERAEHVMLVDLGRNDLGRVCEYGSVQVDELMAVETYSHVMHIVSSVSGTLREGVSPMDALRASLPAGTLSGAPKIRAMQIIDELEPVEPRALRRGGGLPLLHRRARHLHLHPLGARQGRPGARAGGRRASWPTRSPTTRCARPRPRRAR